MSDAAGAAGIRRYLRAIERAWGPGGERPAVLSPRDFKLVTDWFERGIPVELVVDALQEFGARRGRRGRGTAPTSLGRVAAAVEESWSAVVDGRVAGSSSPPPVARVEWARACRERAEREPPGSPLRSLLEGLLARHAEGEDDAALDAALEGALESCVPEDLARRAREEAERRVGSFRARMGAAKYEAVRRRATADRLRRTFGLPRWEPPQA